MKSFKDFLVLIGAAALTLLFTGCSFDLDYDRYAIVYGIADYDNTFGASDLNFTDDDAVAMKSLLEGQGHVVINSVLHAVTKDDMITDFNTAKAQVGKDDLFLFFFSGHGGQDPQGQFNEPPPGDDADEFIVLSDGDAGANYLIYDNELGDLIASIPALKKIVIIDACHSGGMIGNSLEDDATPPDYTGTIDSSLGQAISLWANFSGEAYDISPSDAMVISAAGESEYSWEASGDYNHGIFTYFLLETPKYGDDNNDGYITVTEAYAYARSNIVQLLFPPPDTQYAPHVSGGPVDFVLFEAQ